MNYYMNVWKNFANFSGRARRSEYWYFFLFNTVVMVSLLVLSFALGSTIPYVLYCLYALVALIPSMAVAVRRMHDSGKSGWFMFIPIYNIILAFTAGDRGDNEYGADPKQTEVEFDFDQPKA